VSICKSWGKSRGYIPDAALAALATAGAWSNHFDFGFVVCKGEGRDIGSFLESGGGSSAVDVVLRFWWKNEVVESRLCPSIYVRFQPYDA